VIFPAALAVSQDIGASGKDFIVACVVGYEVGCRVGEYLGKSHYEVRYPRYILVLLAHDYLQTDKI
jgi:2-methylcitrate dehydratase PrpD